MRIKNMLAAAFALAFYNVSAQQSLSLTQIEAEIEARHPALQMLSSRATANEEMAKGAYSWMPPEVGAGFFQTPYNPSRWKQNGTEAGMGMFMLSAQQMFPNRKKQEAQFAYLNAQADIERKEESATLNDLFYSARSNYYSWLIAAKKKKILDENEHLLDFMKQSAEIRFKNGLGKISAYYKVEAALARLQKERIDLDNQIEQIHIALNTLMYRQSTTSLSIDSSYEWVSFPSTISDSSTLMGSRSDIAVINQQIQVNQLERNFQVASLKPEFGIRYDHMTTFGNRPWMFSLMGMVKLPLAGWSSRMNRAKAESLRWENESLKSQQDLIVNAAAGEANRQLSALTAKKRQLLLYREQIIPALQKNFQTMQLAYEQNTTELFELFDSWEALNNTEMEYLDQLKEALLLQANLLQITEYKQP